jgi:dipeptidyl-peptidase-4
MNRFLRIISILLILLSVETVAQNKIFTPEEAVGLNPALSPSGYGQLKWMADTDDFTFSDKQQVMKYSATTNLIDTLFRIKELNALLRTENFDTLQRIPQINWIDATRIYYFNANKLFVFDIASKQVQKITEFPENAQSFSVVLPSLRVAYTIENNLFVADKQTHTQITTEPEGIVCGQTVHRNEFGINGGIFWSPDGNSIAFYRMDERMVANYPIVDIDTRIAEVKNEPYPMAGEKSHEVTLGVYNLETKSTVFMKTGEPAEQYLTSVSWNPDNKTIYIGLLNHDQNHLSLNAYDISNGNLSSVLFQETDEKYVEPMNPMEFIPGKPDRFLWQSQRDGYNHIYEYDTKGNLISQHTKGEWVVVDLVGFQLDKNELYFTGTIDSPLTQNIYKVNLKTDVVERINTEQGIHRALLSKSGKFLIDIYSTRNSPRCITLVSTNTKNAEIIKSEGNLLKDYKLGETSVFSVKSPDGTDLYCRMIKPVDFDPLKKYPVIVYVYGGPHAQLVTDSWLGGANNYLNYLAQKGYVVFTMDNRGSANRGKVFEQAIFRNVGKIEIDDQLTGIGYLKSLEFVDTTRIGVDGWSYGGFLAMTLKLQHPEIFKVAVAGGPVVDWKFYEVMYGERYMDTPQTNPEGYANASLLPQAKNLKGRLLIIHDTEDRTVVWQNSLSFLRQCVDDGILVDYFVYPGHDHNVRGKDRAHLIKKITAYFDDNL